MRKRKNNSRKSDFFSRIDKNGFLRKKVLKRLFILLVSLLIFYFYFVGDYGFLRLLSLKNEKESLILETKRLQAQNMDMEMEIEKLKKNLFCIEKIARERYGMAKKDELIYKFVQPEDNSSIPLPEENK